MTSVRLSAPIRPSVSAKHAIVPLKTHGNCLKISFEQQPLFWTNAYLGLHEGLDLNEHVDRDDQYIYGTVTHQLASDPEYNCERLDFAFAVATMLLWQILKFSQCCAAW
jgi:hypothetical protein